MAFALAYSQPVTGTGICASPKWLRTVRLACPVSSVAAGYVSAPDRVVLLSITNSSSAGPAMDEPSRFLAIGTVIVRLLLVGATETSHPLHTSVYPSRIRKPLPASAELD